MDTSCPETIERPDGSREDEPPWPKEQENKGVAAAEDEDGEFIEEPLSNLAHRLRIPGVGDGFAGHEETVEGAEFCGTDGPSDEEAAGVPGMYGGGVGGEIGVKTDEVGEFREKSLAMRGEDQARAQPVKNGRVGTYGH
ncbi:hypothetical protein JDV02_006571 [Purpureocillium takamizusanense]|uniref:Uncharacterized protein n=1 Tax=Purpureocillium takamizusanense TaxID=2060973 RepID=A0A9Q8QKH8_9HYPO|nr:uncharacterized protein JDV02_006571 [Purpureocillium takamizusanense]UNI20491.1 hypothetical protein JDV02_006571 [Purpureocillium takamizusanense]